MEILTFKSDSVFFLCHSKMEGDKFTQTLGRLARDVWFDLSNQTILSVPFYFQSLKDYLNFLE